MTQDSQQPETMTHSQFLLAAGLFEGALLVAAFLLGWLAGVNPTAQLRWSSSDLLMGCLATGPMLLLLLACFLSRWKGLTTIRDFLRDAVGPLLNRCRVHDLLLLALLAGLCEEVLFRGFLYGWLAPIHPMLAILVTNVLFGAAHAVTPVYGLLAAFLGLYLTALLAADPTPNLLIPIVAHTLYDFVAFLVLVRDYRRFRRLPDA